ncbi:capsid assembly protease [Azospirillaceae bacterium]
MTESMGIDLPHLSSLVFGSPLMIARPKLDMILNVLALRLQGEPTEVAAVAERPFVVTPNGIAIIPVLGTLANRTFGVAAMSGLASYLRLGEQLDLASADPVVRGILLDVDSNGGQAGGVFDLADKVLALRGVKPVYAIADDGCLSAAYALACGAERFYVTQTGAVGSIGVVALHADQSGADQKAGVRYDTISAGERKTDGNPHEPLSDDARRHLQAEVDRLYGLFVAKVATARGLSEVLVRNQQAGVFFGGNAVVAGLADQVGTFASALSDLSSRIATSRSRLLGKSGDTMSSAPKGANTMSETSPTPTAETTTVSETALREQLAAEIAAKAEGPTAETHQALTVRLRAEAVEIVELCQIAGQPKLAAEFVRRGLSPAAVRKNLLNSQAAPFEAAPTTPVSTTAPAGENPLIAAMKAAYPTKG